MRLLIVSWADLIAVAGAEAVALCGGPEISVRLGRLDSRCYAIIIFIEQFFANCIVNKKVILYCFSGLFPP
jgi:hypothetical protein